MNDTENRPTITITDADGKVVEVGYGMTPEEVMEAHKKGTCDAMCPICYDEACRALDDEADWNRHVNRFFAGLC